MSPKTRPTVPGAYSEARELQLLLLADARCKDTKPSVRAGIARAWVELEERKRILRGRPLPGILRPVDKPKPKRRLKRVILEAPGEAPGGAGEAAGVREAPAEAPSVGEAQAPGEAPPDAGV